jgi:hypothetical protein
MNLAPIGFINIIRIGVLLLSIAGVFLLVLSRNTRK